MRFPPPTLPLALCHSRDQAQQVQARLAAWLQPRGLVFNQGKTRIVPGFHAQRGYDLISGLGTVDAGQFVPELAKAAG